MIPAARDSELREAVQGGTLFTIDAEDMSFIFSILRNNMYSDPIKVLVQEYACNARDAHRECGKSAVPLRVTLPTVEDPRYIVRDFGKGMDYKTMVNVFCKYGKSTKRGTNQTGGFGIGAKSAWAYRDDFHVNIYQNGRIYSYEFFIDDSQCGMMNLVDVDDTTEEDGTEIIVGAEEKDIGAFRSNFQTLITFWGIRPKVTNDDFEYAEVDDNEVVYQGENFYIFKEHNNICDKAFVLVDSVPYPINIKALKLENQNLVNLVNKKLGMIARMNEVDVAASREQLNYTAKTINWITEELQRIYDDLDSWVRLEINTYESLWEARCSYKYSSKVFKYIKNLNFKNLMWREYPVKCGVEILLDSDHEDYQENSDNRLSIINCSFYTDYRKGVERLGSEAKDKLDWAINAPIMIVDSRRIPRAKAKAVIENEDKKYGKTVDAVQIIMLPADPDIAEKELARLEEEIHLSQLKPIYAKDVQTRSIKKQYNKRKRGETAVVVGEWTGGCHGRPDKVEHIIEDLEGYFVYSQHSSVEAHNGKEERLGEYHDTLKILTRNYGIDRIFIIPKRFHKKVEKNFALQNLWEFKEKFDRSVDKARVTRLLKKTAKSNVRLRNKWSYLESTFNEDFEKLLDSSSPFRKYLKSMKSNTTTLTVEEQKLVAYARYLTGYKMKDQYELRQEAEKDHTEILKMYPMLNVMDTYGVQLVNKNTRQLHIAAYINAVDSGV